MSLATNAVNRSMMRSGAFSSSGMTIPTGSFPCHLNGLDLKDGLPAGQVAPGGARRGASLPVSRTGAGVIELVRTNDLVMISVIVGLLTQERVAFFVADQHMNATEGSRGFLPRRIMVDAEELARARRLLKDAGLAAELRNG